MKKRILAVDDSRTERLMLTLTLEEAGYQVLEAVDGLDALQKLATEHVDMVISDLNMPNMNGITLIREIRKSPNHRFIPVLMLTSEPPERSRLESREAGASGCLQKPVNPRQLLAVVRMVLA
jgi:two-component system, chemotaxis family, chemotaxis protein CheY